MTAPTAATPTARRACRTPRRHGRLRYKYDRCRCGVCRVAALRDRDFRVAAKAAGTWRPWGDVAAVRAHLGTLRSAGVSLNRICVVSGVGRRSLGRLAAGEDRRVTGFVASAILALTPQMLARPQTSPAALAERGRAERGRAEHDRAGRTAKRDRARRILVPAVGSARRVRALCCIGWPLTETARRCGLEPATLSNISAQPSTRPETAARIKAVYDELSMTPAPPGTPGAVRARSHARKRGWFPPLAWDEGTIDDPAAVPCLRPRRKTTPRPRPSTHLHIQPSTDGSTQPSTSD